MTITKNKLEELANSIKQPWHPIEIARFNDQVVRMAMFKDEFHWHSHKNEDEFFLVHSGKITIDTEDREINLVAGESVVIPKGVKHRPRSSERSIVIMIEPASLISKGD